MMMLLQSQSTMMTTTATSILPSSSSITICKPSSIHKPLIRIRKLPLRCSSVVAPQPTATNLVISSSKPSPAQVSRTIMELSSCATFSTHSPDDDDDTWPLGVAVRFAVDPQGTPIVCLNAPSFDNNKSSLNVQLRQSDLRTTQCTIQGTLHRPDQSLFKSIWEKRFGEKAESHYIHILSVQRVLQIDNFMEDGVWVTSSDYKLATPDPLRDFAHHLVNEINTNNMEDVLRFCNVYVESDFQVLDAKMVWVDRLGMVIHLYAPQNEVFEVRIPFPREVTNQKGAKSSFNGMAQLAWEVEKNYHPLEFEKIKQLKKIASKV